MLTASWFIHIFRKCSLPCLLWVWLVNVSCRLTDWSTWFGLLQLETPFGEDKEPLRGGSLLERVCHRGWAFWFYKPGFTSFSFLLLVWRWTPKSQLPGSPSSSMLLLPCHPCHCELHPSEQTLLPEVVLSRCFISATQKRWICCSSDFPAAARVWGGINSAPLLLWIKFSINFYAKNRTLPKIA